ncbi:MAG: RNA polymerase sigma factor [Thermodesulfobacteriota bacterium]
MEVPGDIELAERAAGGDDGAFECLANRHYTLVYRTAYKWCGIRADAEDIAQEVFVKLARAIRGFRGGSSFTTWLYRITVNTAKDFHRSNAAKKSREAAYIEEESAEKAAAGGPDNNPVSSEDIYGAIEKLPIKQKEAVLLVLAEGLSHREAGVILGCAETTVSWRVFQARRKLTGLLK